VSQHNIGVYDIKTCSHVYIESVINTFKLAARFNGELLIYVLSHKDIPDIIKLTDRSCFIFYRWHCAGADVKLITISNDKCV
jgi:hypothetical protein